MRCIVSSRTRWLMARRLSIVLVAAASNLAGVRSKFLLLQRISGMMIRRSIGFIIRCPWLKREREPWENGEEIPHGWEDGKKCFWMQTRYWRHPKYQNYREGIQASGFAARGKRSVWWIHCCSYLASTQWLECLLFSCELILLGPGGITPIWSLLKQWRRKLVDSW